MITTKPVFQFAIGLIATSAITLSSSGGDHYREPYRGIAIASPIESPDSLSPHSPESWDEMYLPYYSRTTPMSMRWCPTAYVPYYRGYWRNSKVSRESSGLYFLGNTDFDMHALPAADYGIYSGASQDEQRLLRLGAAGPYQGVRADFLSNKGIP